MEAVGGLNGHKIRGGETRLFGGITYYQEVIAGYLLGWYAIIGFSTKELR